MKFDKVYTFLIVTLSLSLMGFQCQKESLFPVPEHQFVDKVSLAPYKNSYRIGDTIWLHYQTASKILVDRISNQNIATDTTFLGLSFQYQKRYPVQFSPVDTFCYTITPQGVNQGLKVLQDFPTYNFLDYLTDCNQNFYYFKVGFIPRTTGIYSINGPSGGIVDCPNKVIRSPYSNISFRFDLASCNKDVYLSIPAASRGESVKGQTEREIDDKKIFVFKVE
jgi:hypothetical protein